MESQVSKIKYKKGMILISITSGQKIQLLNRKSGNKHWNTKKLSSNGKAHMIHEGTLDKFYEVNYAN